jgi:hypothetical protein
MMLRVVTCKWVHLLKIAYFVQKLMTMNTTIKLANIITVWKPDQPQFTIRDGEPIRRLSVELDSTIHHRQIGLVSLSQKEIIFIGCLGMNLYTTVSLAIHYLVLIA